MAEELSDDPALIYFLPSEINIVLHVNRKCLLLASMLLISNASVQAAVSPPELTAAMARAMIHGCSAHATAKGWKMHIAVVDSGANLIGFERMDHSFLGAGEIALNKAQTSAKFPFPTRIVEELSYGKGGKAPVLPGLAHVKGIIAFAGWLPIFAGSTHLGGIGVSGGTADEDEACAQAALDAVKNKLNGGGA